MSLTSSRIRAINAVFEAGSFSQAARRLGISQPAVTQQVRSLEADFGVSLFERRGNDLVPTTVCREFVAVTSQMHGLESQALAVLRQNDALKDGDLRIGIGNSMPGMALISAFHRFIRISRSLSRWATGHPSSMPSSISGSMSASFPTCPVTAGFVGKSVCVRALSRSCIRVTRWPAPESSLARNWRSTGWCSAPSSRPRNRLSIAPSGPQV